jgi:hypothetical protein
VAVTDGRYVLDIPHSAIHGVRIVDTLTKKTVVNYVPPAPSGVVWNVDNVWFSAPWAVIQESTYDGKLPVRAWRYDLRTGARKPIGAEAKMPTPLTYLGWSAKNGTLAYGSGGAYGTGSCLVTVDIATLTWKKRHCVTGKALVDRTYVGPSKTVMFKTATNPGSGKPICATLFTQSAFGDDQAKPVAQQKKCEGFSGFATDDWAMWSEISTGAEAPNESTGYARTADGKIFQLGQVNTGSIIECGGYAYWSYTRDDEYPMGIIRWAPGHDAAIIRRSKMGIYSQLGCDNGQLTVTELEDVSTALVIVPPA